MKPGLQQKISRATVPADRIESMFTEQGCQFRYPLEPIAPAGCDYKLLGFGAVLTNKIGQVQHFIGRTVKRAFVLQVSFGRFRENYLAAVIDDCDGRVMEGRAQANVIPLLHAATIGSLKSRFADKSVSW